ncbi:hypothetical protein NKI34_19740 [Mesorhizobium sp. M0700]|uniref:hypothetical protein n=1 Tax=Mesorhizobium sp. M0700 TaxID=2956988 RepID=UPI00333515F4
MTLASTRLSLYKQLAYGSGVQPDIELILYADISEDPCLLFDVVTPDGLLQLLGNMEMGSNHLVVRDLHIGGDAEVQWGWSKLRKLGRVIAEKLNVDYIEIHGAVRTTGANPGRRPGVVRLLRPTEPQFSSRREYS